MAEVPVNINGVIIDYYGRTIMGPIKIVGQLSRSDVGVGGGPMPPGDGGGGGGGGEGIWGPGDPRPQPPIANVPGIDNPDPPGFGQHPAHPIVLPPDRPTDPPTEPPTQPEDPNWQWGWNRSLGWHPVYVPGEGDPGPH